MPFINYAIFIELLQKANILNFYGAYQKKLPVKMVNIQKVENMPFINYAIFMGLKYSIYMVTTQKRAISIVPFRKAPNRGVITVNSW